jgi:hypothetical protein
VVVHYPEAGFLDVQVRKEDNFTPLDMSTGLGYGYSSLGDYVSVSMCSHSWVDARYMWIYLFFTEKELRDAGVSNAATLVVYGYNYSSHRWQPLSTSLPWVNEITVNTTGVVVGGKHYAGYVAINISTVKAVQSYALAGKVQGMNEVYFGILILSILTLLLVPGIAMEYRRKKRK